MVERRMKRSYNNFMRMAFALLGVAWLIIGIGVYFFLNREPATDHDTSTMATTTLSLTSPAFAEGASIPSRFTCDGQQVNPELKISGIPEGTKTLALIMDDPDVPKQVLPAGVFDHWVLFNIPSETTVIPESGSVGVVGANGAGQNAYTGPCPPPQYEPSEHRYLFTLYALDAALPLEAGASKDDVLKAMQGHVLAQTQLVGRYKRQ